MSIKIEIWRWFLSLNSKNIYTISGWSHPCLFHIEIFDFCRKFHIHDFQIMLCVSSLLSYADILSIRHRVHHAQAGLRPCANILKQTDLSNPGRFWKYWIWFLPGIVNADCKLSTIARFQKKWILKALFSRHNSPSDIQLLKKEGFLDMRSENFFFTVRNPYPLF